MIDVNTLRVIKNTYPKANVELGMLEIEPGLFCTVEYINRALEHLGYELIKTSEGAKR